MECKKRKVDRFAEKQCVRNGIQYTKKYHYKPKNGSKFCIFTIIELLVVISIIVILVSMLLPALNRAREVAKGMKCKSNLKQLGIYWANYALDFADYYLPLTMSRNADWVGTSGSGKAYWYEELMMTYVVNGPRGSQKKRQNSKIFICPATQPAKKVYSSVEMYLSYGYNAGIYCAGLDNPFMSDYFKQPLTKVGNFRNIDRTVLMADTWAWYQFPENESNWTYGVRAGLYLWSKYRANIGRYGAHGMGMNKLFFDGHVNMERGYWYYRPSGGANIWEAADETELREEFQ
jgi:competence protein ComGC